MKRFFTLALIPGLVCGSAVIADDAEFRNIVILNQYATENSPTIPAQVQCETPVVIYSVPQTVRRVVPRTTYQTVTKTIMVPTTVLETRQTQSVEYREEAHQRPVTVYEQVPEKRLVTTEQTILVPATRQRTETYTVQVPVERLVQQSYTVDKVVTETRTRKQTVSRCVSTAGVRTVISGANINSANLSGVELTKSSSKSDLGGVRVRASMVGRLEPQSQTLSQEAVTVMRPQLVEQTIAYDVQVTRPETHTRLVKQLDYRTETRTRNVPETVHVPKVQQQTHEVTQMRSVPRQKTETYSVQVPHIVTKQVQVPVTKMVAQQITEHVPVTTYDVIEEPVSNCYSFER